MKLTAADHERPARELGVPVVEPIVRQGALRVVEALAGKREALQRRRDAADVLLLLLLLLLRRVVCVLLVVSVGVGESGAAMCVGARFA